MNHQYCNWPSTASLEEVAEDEAVGGPSTERSERARTWGLGRFSRSTVRMAFLALPIFRKSCPEIVFQRYPASEEERVLNCSAASWSSNSETMYYCQCYTIFLVRCYTGWKEMKGWAPWLILLLLCVQWTTYKECCSLSSQTATLSLFPLRQKGLPFDLSPYGHRCATSQINAGQHRTPKFQSWHQSPICPLDFLLRSSPWCSQWLWSVFRT